MAKTRPRHKVRFSSPTTRVSVIVITEDERILLVRHRKGSRLYWVLPGGRLEYGESINECAARELREETGLDIEVQKFVFLSEAIAPDHSRHIVNIYLTGKVVGGSMQLGDEPVLAGVEYVPLAELNRLTLFPPVGRIIQRDAPGGFSGQIFYLGNLWV